MAGFTAGPYVIGVPMSGYPALSFARKAILGADGIQVAYVMTDLGGGEDDANANLLIAAPDLYEVVRRALAAGVFTGKEGKSTHLGEAAEAAMAKANGETA